MMFLPSSAVMPSGSLTAGVPAAFYGAGRYAFRTSVLFLGMDILIPRDGLYMPAWEQAVQQIMPGNSVRNVRIATSGSFNQQIPMSEQQFLIAALTSMAEVALDGAAVLGPLFFIDAQTNYISAEWLTITGNIDAPNAFSLDDLNRSISGAIGATVRLQHRERRDIVVSVPAESVLLRTRMPDACSGGHLFTNVTAAACTRVERTGAWIAAAQPARPPTPQQPLQPQPVAPQPARPSPRPATRPPAPQPVAPQQQYQPPAEAISPWWYAVGAVAIAGAIVLITTKDSR